MEFARPLGAFDEYAIGNDFWSVPAQLFIWGDPPGEPSVPQVLVIERTVSWERNKPIRFAPYRVIRRVIGDSIPIWVNGGAQIRLSAP